MKTQHQRSEKTYQPALTGIEETHISTPGTVKNLGPLHQDHGKLVEVEQLCQSALTGHEKTLGVIIHAASALASPVQSRCLW